MRIASTVAPFIAPPLQPPPDPNRPHIHWVWRKPNVRYTNWPVEPCLAAYYVENQHQFSEPCIAFGGKPPPDYKNFRNRTPRTLPVVELPETVRVSRVPKSVKDWATPKEKDRVRKVTKKGSRTTL